MGRKVLTEFAVLMVSGLPTMYLLLLTIHHISVNTRKVIPHHLYQDLVTHQVRPTILTRTLLVASDKFLHESSLIGQFAKDADAFRLRGDNESALVVTRS